MDYRELNHIERAMWRIEDKDFNYSTNKRWLLLKQAQNLWPHPEKSRLSRLSARHNG